MIAFHHRQADCDSNHCQTTRKDLISLMQPRILSLTFRCGTKRKKNGKNNEEYDAMDHRVTLVVAVGCLPIWL
jgi:hypothetical protein